MPSIVSIYFCSQCCTKRIICGETEIPTDKYQSELQKLKEHDPRTHQKGLESQCNLLYQVTPNPDDVYCSTARTHSDKNRSNEYLPCENIIYLIIFLCTYYLFKAERFLVTLREAHGYVNASFLNVSSLLPTNYLYCVIS